MMQPKNKRRKIGFFRWVLVCLVKTTAKKLKIPTFKIN